MAKMFTFVVFQVPTRDKKYIKAHIPLRTAFALGTQPENKWDKKHEIYMAKARTLHWAPNTTYIPLARVGVLRWGKRKF